MATVAEEAAGRAWEEEEAAGAAVEAGAARALVLGAEGVEGVVVVVVEAWEERNSRWGLCVSKQVRPRGRR